MEYKNGTLQKYLDDLGARLPAPGGGSAAALVAACGAGLLSMVVNFTLGKPAYARYENELRHTLAVSEKLKAEFLNLVDLDVAAYQSKNIKDCLNVPFMLARLCYEGMKLCLPLVKKGNKNLASDVAVAAAMLEAAYVSARFNVDINLKAFPDKKTARSIRRELDLKEKRVRKIRHDTEVKVGALIRG